MIFQNNFVSIIVPVRNEKDFISNLINSILEQDYDKELLEVFLIDGLSTDGTSELIQNYTQKYKFIKHLTNLQKTVPFALNLGIKQAKGDIIIRLDAHAKYPKNYISTLVNYLNKLNADNVGASAETITASNTLKARSIAIAMSTKFGVGNASFRLNKSTSIKFIEVDTVPFGCYRRDVFDRIGLFDEELTRNQDNEFNERLKKAGGRIYLIPSVKIKYYARENYTKLFKMFYQYGYFGPLVDLKLGRPTRVRRYIPALFVLSLAVPLILSTLYFPFFYVWLFTIIIYLTLSFIFAFTNSIINKTILLIPFITWGYFISHISYGTGYLIGFLDFVILKKRNVSIKLSR